MGGLVGEIFLKCARVCQLIWAEWCTWKETEWVCLIKSLWCTIGCWVRHIWVLWGVTNYLLNTLSLPLLLPASPLTPHSSLVTPFFVAQSQLHVLQVHCIAPHHPHPITYLWLSRLKQFNFFISLVIGIDPDSNNFGIRVRLQFLDLLLVSKECHAQTQSLNLSRN
jgi:hypothetical protein